MSQHVCTDCHTGIAAPEVVLRTVSSSIEPVAFHEACYRQHVPSPRTELL